MSDERFVPETPDSLIERLGRLPPRPPAVPIAAQLARRPRAVFARHAEQPPGSFLGLVYHRLEPGLAATVVVVYLGWALQTAFALLR